MTASARHETRALLRAHLSAASSFGGHLTRHCPVCHRLLRLAMDSAPHDFLPRPAEHTESAESTEPTGGTERPPEPVEGEGTAPVTQLPGPTVELLASHRRPPPLAHMPVAQQPSRHVTGVTV
ncbi:DUF6274 family protein [Streptomyces sp. NPDC050388]|uniref:DUF6274 family protein n=1 Tax=Streptomyces sp. NPDC050388 TaxID=3155781 RepID=UPI003414402C